MPDRCSWCSIRLGPTRCSRRSSQMMASTSGPTRPWEQHLAGQCPGSGGSWAPRRCMTKSTGWPRIGPATDSATTRQDWLRKRGICAGKWASDGIAAGGGIRLENPLKMETRIERPRLPDVTSNSPTCKIADRYVNQEGRPMVCDTPSAVPSASNAGPPRDTCRSGPNTKTPNRPLTCVFSRGAGRT